MFSLQKLQKYVGQFIINKIENKSFRLSQSNLKHLNHPLKSLYVFFFSTKEAAHIKCFVMFPKYTYRRRKKMLYMLGYLKSFHLRIYQCQNKKYIFLVYCKIINFL